MSYDEIHIGNDAFSKAGNKVFLKDDVRKEHCHVIGGTGTGKSKLLEHMIRQDIKNGKGLCLIDPHGSLFEAVLKWVVANGFDHRLVVIDPNEKGRSVGLNFLEYDRDIFDAGQHVENVIEDMGRAKGEDIFTTAQLIIWLRNFLTLAAYSGLTLNEVYYLINEKNSRLREVLTERIPDDDGLKRQLSQAWDEYDNASTRIKAEIMKLPVWSRIQTFLATKTMRQIVSQKDTTVDFYKAMEKGHIVLVNLHGRLSENEKDLLGKVIIDKLFQAAVKRRPDSGKMFYVYIDEFGRFVSERIARGLEELRKRRVPFILAHQELEQLRDENGGIGKRMLASIMSNTTVKIAFRISRSDAEAMALEMFGGFITGTEIKHEQKVISFWPRKTTERSRGYSKAISEGEAQSFTSGMGQASSQMAGSAYVPGTGILGTDELQSYINSFVTGSSEMSGSSRGAMRGYSTSEIEMEFPFYDLEPFEQVVSTSFYSVEEIKERYTQFLQNQKGRFFHIRILGEVDRPPIPLMTPTVQDITLLPSVLKRAKLKSIMSHSKTSKEISELSKARHNELLKMQSEEDEDNIQNELDGDHWQ